MEYLPTPAALETRTISNRKSCACNRVKVRLILRNLRISRISSVSIFDFSPAALMPNSLRSFNLVREKVQYERVDCETSHWKHEKCNVTCGEGFRWKFRSIIVSFYDVKRVTAEPHSRVSRQIDSNIRKTAVFHVRSRWFTLRGVTRTAEVRGFRRHRVVITLTRTITITTANIPSGPLGRLARKLAATLQYKSEHEPFSIIPAPTCAPTV